MHRIGAVRPPIHRYLYAGRYHRCLISDMHIGRHWSILLAVINISSKIDSVTISYITWKVLPFDAAFRLFWQFFTVHPQFRPYYYFPFKIWRHICIRWTHFPVKTRSFRVCDTIFGNFCYEAQASVPRTWNKLCEWVIEYAKRDSLKWSDPGRHMSWTGNVVMPHEEERADEILHCMTVNQLIVGDHCEWSCRIEISMQPYCVLRPTQPLTLSGMRNQ